MNSEWKLLRTKTDETVDDTDWVGTNTVPDASICAAFQGNDAQGRAWTGIEVLVVGVDAAGLRQNPSGMTVDLRFIEVIERPTVYGFPAGGTANPVVRGTTVQTGVLVQENTAYFACNGSHRFTIRITNDASDAVDNLQVLWRPVSL